MLSDGTERYGYNVPSFGIAFTRQNNAVFKSVNVSMNTPIVTGAYINAMSRIFDRAEGNGHRVAFVGQDLYPVYSNYSYICEVEMMGDAQIQPLMYFQLMNIPMWRGTYMVFSVSHTITPGNMVTTFKGMKLSKFAVPYSDEWYILKFADGTDTLGLGSGLSSRVTPLDSSLYTSILNPKDHFNDRHNYQTQDIYNRRRAYNGITTNPKLISLYNSLFEEVEEYQRKSGNGKVTWKVGISSVNRSGTSVSQSQHNKGEAMDLQIFDIKTNGTLKDNKRLMVVMDILYCLHRNDIHQVIYEGCGRNNLYRPNCLHVGIKTQSAISTNFFLSYNSDGKALDYTKDRVNLPEFVSIARKGWGKGDFYNVFINFKDRNSANALFSSSNGNTGEVYAKWRDDAKISEVNEIYSKLKDSGFGWNDIQIAGVIGNLMQESACSPSAIEKGSSANRGVGLAQWTHQSRVDLAVKTMGLTSKWDIPNVTTETQMDFLIYEIRKNYGSLITEMKNATNVMQSAEIFKDKYEGKNVGGLGNRQSYAKGVLDRIKSGVIHS